MSETLTATATHLLEVRHSRFLAHATAIDTPLDALDFLARVADPSATHNCWAYRVGSEYRSSDDGEPAGTAGRPILSSIEGQGCDRVMVVVTRWYGGIKLGSGGLVRAYGGAAAERQPLVQMHEVALRCGFDDIGSVHAALPAYGALKQEEAFNETGATLRLSLPSSRIDALKTHLRDATRNRVRFVESDSE